MTQEMLGNVGDGLARPDWQRRVNEFRKFLYPQSHPFSDYVITHLVDNTDPQNNFGSPLDLSTYIFDVSDTNQPYGLSNLPHGLLGSLLMAGINLDKLGNITMLRRGVVKGGILAALTLGLAACGVSAPTKKDTSFGVQEKPENFLAQLTNKGFRQLSLSDIPVPPTAVPMPEEPFPSPIKQQAQLFVQEKYLDPTTGKLDPKLMGEQLLFLAGVTVVNPVPGDEVAVLIVGGVAISIYMASQQLSESDLARKLALEASLTFQSLTNSNILKNLQQQAQLISQRASSVEISQNAQTLGYITYTDADGNPMEVGTQVLIPGGGGYDDLTIRDLNAVLENIPSGIPNSADHFFKGVTIDPNHMLIEINLQGFNDMRIALSQTELVSDALSNDPLFRRLLTAGRIVTISSGGMSLQEIQNQAANSETYTYPNRVIRQGPSSREPVRITGPSGELLEAYWRINLGLDGTRTGLIRIDGTGEWQGTTMEASMDATEVMMFRLYTQKQDGTGERHPDMYAGQFFNEVIEFFGLRSISAIESFWESGSDNRTMFDDNFLELSSKGIPIEDARRLAALATWTGGKVLEHFPQTAVLVDDRTTAKGKEVVVVRYKKVENPLPFNNTALNLTPEECTYVVDTVDRLLEEYLKPDADKIFADLYRRSYYANFSYYIALNKLMEAAVGEEKLQIDSSSVAGLQASFAQMMQIHRTYSGQQVMRLLEIDFDLNNIHKVGADSGMYVDNDIYAFLAVMDEKIGAEEYVALLMYLHKDSVFFNLANMDVPFNKVQIDSNKVTYSQRIDSDLSISGPMNPAYLDKFMFYLAVRDRLPFEVREFYDSIIRAHADRLAQYGIVLPE
jgi:hypothetical protein